jgi:hypothetical protein
MLRCIVRIGRAWPVHKVQIDVIHTKALERRVNSVLHTVVPCVIKLGGDPDLFARNTRVPDALAYFSFVTVGEGTTMGQSAQNFYSMMNRGVFNSRVNMAITLQQSNFDGLSDFVGLRLPGTETDCGDLVTRVQGVGLPIGWKLLAKLFSCTSPSHDHVLRMFESRHFARMNKQCTS